MVHLIGGPDRHGLYEAEPVPSRPDVSSALIQDQIASAVYQYIVAHPDVRGPVGRAPTPEEIAAQVTIYLAANPPATTVDVGPTVQAYLEANIDTLLAAHIEDVTPHSVYDNMEDFALLFENRLL